MKVKKIIAGVLACVTVSGALPYSNYIIPENSAVTAYAETYENLEYTKYNDYIEITGCKESVTEIVIPSEIDGLPVTSIGDSAFLDCTGLTEINIPEGVTSINNSAFICCTGLTSITVEKNNPNYADIDGVLFNKDFSEIISYPAGKKETSYNIPNSVTSIGNYSFVRCTGLTSITIPDSVKLIGYSAFKDCKNLTDIKVDADNLDYADSDGILFNKNISTLLMCPEGKSGTYNIPESVVSIEESAFYNCSRLTEIIIPESVTSIEIGAFYNCSNLKDITIPDSIQFIGEQAFYNTEWYYNQPDGLVYAGKVAYCYKGEMPENTEIILRDDTVSITNSAFYGCLGLKSIIIPDSVKSIGNGIFYYCLNLTDVIIPKSITSIGWHTFKGCSSLKSMTIPENITSIEDYAFQGCSELTKIIIENPECEIENDENTISDTATIYGYKDSTAQAYAEKYKRNFVVLDDKPSDSKIIKGDVTGDGTIDIADVVAVASYVGDSTQNQLSNDAIIAGDVHNTGDGLTGNDVLMIQQYIAKIITEL